MCRWTRGIRQERLRYMLEDSAPVVVLTQEEAGGAVVGDEGAGDRGGRRSGCVGRRAGEQSGCGENGTDGRGIWRM